MPDRSLERAGAISTRNRLLIAIAVGALAATWSYAHQRAARAGVGHAIAVMDLEPVLVSARALLTGDDPYAATGPGRPFHWPWPQPYPMTAFVALLPLAALPRAIAAALFMGTSIGWLAYAVMRFGKRRMPMLASGAVVWALICHQWSPLLVAAALTPALAGLLATKPPMGAALLAGSDRKTVVGAIAGGAVLVAIAFALRPGWVTSWLAVLRGGEALHFAIPVTRLPFGPAILLGLLRWRRPEARLLVALGCVPQSNAVCDVLPLFLVATTFWESALLAVTTNVLVFVHLRVLKSIPPGSGPAAWKAYVDVSADWLIWAVYLPCVVMVLRRPNEASGHGNSSSVANGWAIGATVTPGRTATEKLPSS